VACPPVTNSNPADLAAAREIQNARRQEITRRSAAEGISSLLLFHIPAFQAAQNITRPLDDNEWRLLLPRIQAQRPEAEAILKARQEQFCKSGFVSEGEPVPHASLLVETGNLQRSNPTPQGTPSAMANLNHTATATVPAEFQSDDSADTASYKGKCMEFGGELVTTSKDLHLAKGIPPNVRIYAALVQAIILFNRHFKTQPSLSLIADVITNNESLRAVRST
jgi:hypothetical protein